MTKLVGILNFTPDSFSDGGRYSAVGEALAHIEKLIEDGADVIDIGAESTRPGATPMTAAEEWERLAPLFAELSVQGAIFSLDTRHAENARRALDKGFRWINDVSGVSMPDTLKGYDYTLVAMHSLTVPADKNITLPEGCDVIAVLKEWVAGAGLPKDNIIFDPGLGFGKTAAQSGQIIERIGELKTLGLPLLIGHSRKSFLTPSPLWGEGRGEGVLPLAEKLQSVAPPPHPNLLPGGEKEMNRDKVTLAVSKKLIAAGVDYLRVHDVAAHRALLEAMHD